MLNIMTSSTDGHCEIQRDMYFLQESSCKHHTELSFTAEPNEIAKWVGHMYHVIFEPYTLQTK